MLEQFDAATVAMIGRNSPLTSSLVSGDPAFAAADLSWRREAPFRPVDWRWKLAQRALVEKMPRRAELLDSWVHRIKKHLRSRHEVTKSRVSKRTSYDPILAEVSALRFAADPLIGGELEALILTGEPRPVVAEISGLDEPVVEAFEQCFFDVRPKLEAWSYIIHIVIGPGIYEGFRLDDLPPIWKTIAYFRGRYSLAVVLQAFPGSRVRPWPHWYEATPVERARLIAACRRAVLTRCVPPGSLRLKDLALLAKLKDAGRQRQGPLAPEAPLVPTLDRTAMADLAGRWLADTRVRATRQSSLASTCCDRPADRDLELGGDGGVADRSNQLLPKPGMTTYPGMGRWTA